MKDSAKTRKLVLVISSLRGGGAEKVISNLANYWAVQGIDITLVTFDKMYNEAYSVSPDVNRKIISNSTGSNIFARLFALGQRILKLRGFLKVEQPDAVLSFMAPINLVTLVSSIGLRVHCVVSERTNPAIYSYGVSYDLLRRLLYPYANQIIVQTERIAEWFSDQLNANITVIPNFIEDHNSNGKIKREKIVIAVGRLSSEKGFDVLIHAFAKLSNSFPDWKVLILGEGSERQNLENLIKDYCLEDKVELKGRVNNPFLYLNRASIAVQPSKVEGFPNALLEAMSCALPVIASREAGYMLIEDNVNGLLVDADNVDQLIVALERLLACSQLRNTIGKNAEKVRETYSQNRVIQMWEKVLFPSQ